MFFLIKLAVKTIRRHPVKSMITILSIALSVAIILATFITNAAIKKSSLRITEELSTGKTGIWLQEATANNAGIGTRQEGFSLQIIPRLLENTTVQSVHPLLKVLATVSSFSKPVPEECHIYGIRFQDDRTVRNHHLSSGSYPTSTEQVLIGEYFKEKLQLKIGSDIMIQSPKGQLILKVTGFLSWGKGSGSLNNNRVIFADLALVQEYFNYNEQVTELALVLVPGAIKSQVAAQLKAFIPSNVKIITDPIAEAVSNDQTHQLRISAILFTFITLIIAGFIIYNTLFSIIEQSRKELGLLRLIGMTRFQIIHYFLIQSFIYALLGSILGIGIGILLSFGLLYLASFIVKYQSVIFEWPSLISILISTCIGIIGSLLVGVFPAIKASISTPLDIFNGYNNTSQYKTGFTKKTVYGVILLIFGIGLSFLPINIKALLYIRFSAPLFLFIGICMILDFILPLILKLMSHLFLGIFGLPGLLGVTSLNLRLKRTSVTVSAVMIAVAVIIGYIGMTFNLKGTISDWMAKTKWADILIFSISGAEIDTTILNKIKEYPFIEKVNPIRYYFIPYQHQNLSDNGLLFQGVDPKSFEEFTGIRFARGDGVKVGAGLRNKPFILVNEMLPGKIGLKPGNIISFNTPNGKADFVILDTVKDYSDFIHRFGKVIYGTYDDLVNYWGVTGYTVIQARLTKGFSPDQAKKELINGLTSQYNIKIITNREERNDVQNSIDRVFMIFYAINAIIFIIVFISIFNTVLINVLFQTREFALLRIAGCFSKQIRLMVISEALVMGAIGSVLAALAGFWLAREMTVITGEIIGITLNFYQTWVLAFVLFILTLIFAVIATFYPQRVATNISISSILQRMEEI